MIGFDAAQAAYEAPPDEAPDEGQVACPTCQDDRCEHGRKVCPECGSPGCLDCKDTGFIDARDHCLWCSRCGLAGDCPDCDPPRPGEE